MFLKAATGLKDSIYTDNSSNMLKLSYSGKTVFNDILPIFDMNKEWFFWKEPQILQALIIKQIVWNKEHLTKDGLTQLVKILYSYPNAYKRPLDLLLKLIDEINWTKGK